MSNFSELEKDLDPSLTWRIKILLNPVSKKINKTLEFCSSMPLYVLTIFLNQHFGQPYSEYHQDIYVLLYPVLIFFEDRFCKAVREVSYKNKEAWIRLNTSKYNLQMLELCILKLWVLDYPMLFKPSLSTSKFLCI